jgi:dihydroflavonol-4-reductase
MMFPLVDVRDAAHAHVKALECAAAKNQRIIVVGANIWFKEMAEILAENYNKFGYKVKTGEIKLWMLKVASWIDDTAKSILPQWDKVQRLSNRRSIEMLGITYCDYKRTILDMAESFIDKGIVKDKRAGAGKKK